MNITDMIRYDEGEKLTIYKDSEGYYTIGVGHLLTKSPSKEQALIELDKLVGHKAHGYINEQESDKILNDDINKATQQIGKTELFNTYTIVDSVRRAALINMVFQLGINGVLKFKKMIAYMNTRQFDKAADEALDSLWAKQTPNRAKRVTDVIRYGDFRSYE
ncbi:glycoside hydrolase family protein [Escherichia coli]|nr:glycoside hydrolase family protein [Escherichia coli]EJK2350154.1 glycoside hydrolase family protein [Escherichia coli]